MWAIQMGSDKKFKLYSTISSENLMSVNLFYIEVFHMFINLISVGRFVRKINEEDLITKLEKKLFDGKKENLGTHCSKS